MTISALNVQLNCSLVTKNIDVFAPSQFPKHNFLVKIVANAPLITQRNQQASPEGPANQVCEILSEIKDIKYNKVP
jgi:hypothetical protein